MRYLLILVLFSVTSLATLSSAEAAKEVPKTELKKRLSFYQGLSSLYVAFVQTKKVKDIDLRVKVRGFMNVEFPDTIHWKIVQPAKSEVHIFPKEIQVGAYDKNGNFKTEKYSLNDPQLGDFAKSLKELTSWLKLDIETISKNYKIFQANPNQYRFQPKKPGVQPFTNLLMNLKPSGHLASLEISEASGDTIEFQFMEPKVKRKGK